MSMLSTGVSGLNAAQLALNTVSNNIANAGTAGYSRQSVEQVASVGASNGRFTVGNGVDVVAVQRAYSQYLTQALWSSNTALQGATTFDGLASTLNSLFSNSGNLQSALDDFYSAFSDVANSPGLASTRQAALGSASSLTTVFNTLSQQLAQQQTQVNGQIGDSVDSINAITGQIAKLNQQIQQAGSQGGAPNALLDQRDNLVQQLAGYTGISTVSESNGAIDVYTSSGESLVSGSKSFSLSLGRDPYDPSRRTVLDSSGNDITDQLAGGSLGALIDYRDNVLVSAQNGLGQAALALSSSVNGQQAQGLDLDGNQGKPIFNSPAPTVLPSGKNSANAATVGASVGDVSRLTSSDYILTYTGADNGANGWTLTTTGGQSVDLTANDDGTLSADGLTFSVSGTPQAGDSYEIEPTRNAAGSLSVSMTDPDGIAAAAALTATAGSANTGGAAVKSIAVSDAGDENLLEGATVTFGPGGSYTVTVGGDQVATGTYQAGQPITANGWSLSLDGTPADGDSFTVQKNDGLDDNSNALALAGLADAGVLDGGKTSVVDSYASLSTQVGTVGSQADADLTTQTNLFNQAQDAQQSAAGVNLDEEASNLIKFQQAYQASAQVISTAQTIFSSLLSAIQG
jgi:flagellar hook-associated protein 1 FlgK